MALTENPKNGLGYFQCFPFPRSHEGIIKGDEIMVINGAIVSDLDMMFIESVLQEEISLCMMMRSSRTGKESFLDTLVTVPLSKSQA